MTRAELALEQAHDRAGHSCVEGGGFSKQHIAGSRPQHPPVFCTKELGSALMGTRPSRCASISSCQPQHRSASGSQGSGAGAGTGVGAVLEAGGATGSDRLHCQACQLTGGQPDVQAHAGGQASRRAPAGRGQRFKAQRRQAGSSRTGTSAAHRQDGGVVDDKHLLDGHGGDLLQQDAPAQHACVSR